MSEHPITLGDIYRARARIAGVVRRTPLVHSPALTAATGADVHLKLEHHQATGSFKLRGATNAVMALTEDERRQGVVGVSTGNHGRGLAQAAKAAGIPCTICMSKLVPRNKIEAIRALGAEIRIVGNSQDEAEEEARTLAAQGLVMIPPFDHADVIAGQGTVGLEIMEDMPDADTIVVPLSGGGLIAGIALAARTINPAVRVVGVTMDRGAAMHESLKAGRPVAVEEVESLADSLGGGIGLDNQFTFPLVRDLVDRTLLVTENEIADGVRHAYSVERQVVEGGAAVGISALIHRHLTDTGRTVVVMTGNNIDMDLHRRIINGEDVT